MNNIWANERALNLAEQILGTQDIAGHPVWNLRTKIPNNQATTVPWHQGGCTMFSITPYLMENFKFKESDKSFRILLDSKTLIRFFKF